MHIRPLCLSLTVIVSAIFLSTGVSAVEFTTHNLQIKIDVPSQTASIIDKGFLKLNQGTNLFMLPASATNVVMICGDDVITLTELDRADTSAWSPSQKTGAANLEIGDKAGIYSFENMAQRDECEFTISYTATFNDSVEDVRFSNENLGREITGTILDKGTYLSPESYFYPQSGDAHAMFAITANIPSTWESIADGDRVTSIIDGDRKIQSWENPYRSDGLMFFSAPFVTKSAISESVEVACYFFEEDTSLIDGYLEAAVEYIKMYNHLIGNYPYTRFTVAENFFPTGYGMPAWTLLGQQVIRLPFIKATSLGHEVLHNWWGNSVYVDYSRGNWCESATVYGADYRYKLMESPEAARDYRKNILKQYHSYVHESNDFPIRDFKSRTSPDTRTIGYNKAMMVWHLIHEVIGDEAFFGTWKDIYGQDIGKYISWEEWIAAFEKRCGCDLWYIIPQWIDRAGAPRIGVNLIANSVNGDMRSVTFDLTQPANDLYTLSVPVRFGDAEHSYDTTIMLVTDKSEVTMAVPADFTEFAVDPDFSIFRQLYDSEIEPIVSAVLGLEINHFGAGPLSPEMKEAATQFSQFVSGNDSIELTAIAQALTDVSGIALTAFNPEDLPGYLSKLVSVSADSISLDGSTYPRAGHTFVLTAQDWIGYEKCMVVISDDAASLPRVGQLVPHYGKYSYLVFEGARNVGKGQWPVFDSPLKMEL